MDFQQNPKKLLMRPVLIFCIFFLFITSIFSQRKTDLRILEDSLNVIASGIKKSADDSVRSGLNKRFLFMLKKTLENRESFDYQFESLTTIAKLKSPDDRFRIYNWNLPAGDGTNQYYCLVQFREKNHVNVLQLTDVSDTLKDPEFRRLSLNAWYGALYYKIIRNESAGKVYYTLLGWNGVNSGLFRKVIEVMTIDNCGIPVFGAELFRGYQTGKNTRIIFSYSSASTMILRYDQQFLPDQGKSQKITTQEKAKKKLEWIIIFDRLGSLTEFSEDSQKAYPVPTGENLDGFVFGNGVWNYIQNIPVRNQ